MIRAAGLTEMRARGAALFDLAARETGNPGVINWPALEALAAAGCLVLLAVEVDGHLVGYACAAVGPEFWSEEIGITTLSLFVQRRHRGVWGLRLLRDVVAEGRRKGATFVRVHARSGSRFAALLDRMGMTEKAVVFEASLTAGVVDAV
jgi:hypothetical protein